MIEIKKETMREMLKETTTYVYYRLWALADKYPETRGEIQDIIKKMWDYTKYTGIYNEE